MKANEDVRKPETFEDIVFDGRNKSYGAFDLKKKRNKYLMVSFLVTFVGFTTTVAVPFLGTLKEPGTKTITFETDPVIIRPAKTDQPKLVVPPPPPPIRHIIAKIDRNVSYGIPEIVENADNNGIELDFDVIHKGSVNSPVDVEIDYYSEGTTAIDEPEETKVYLYPSEPAVFMGCPDLSCFHKWIVENIRYPEEAASQNVFGKVILEFCVNSKGKIVDINVLRPIHPSLDKEAIRVISSSPLWTPAKQGGTPVKQKFVIPCSFEMN